MSRAGRGLSFVIVGLLAVTSATSSAGPAPRQVGDARLEPLAFPDLLGWAEDDHAAAFVAFRRSCESLAAGAPP